MIKPTNIDKQKNRIILPITKTGIVVEYNNQEEYGKSVKHSTYGIEIMKISVVTSHGKYESRKNHKRSTPQHEIKRVKCGYDGLGSDRYEKLET